MTFQDFKNMIEDAAAIKQAESLADLRAARRANGNWGEDDEDNSWRDDQATAEDRSPYVKP
jgi:hypothetical protein